MLTTGIVDHVDTRLLAREPDVQILSLTLAEPFAFQAGQYLEVLHPDGTPIPLSIASPPEALPALTLHYRSTPGAPDAERMDTLLRDARPLTIRGPGGDVRLAPEDDRPLLLVCGGTGISQALCLATAQRLRHPQTAVEILACADHAEDLYFEDLIPDGATRTLIADPARDASNAGLAWLRARAPRLEARTWVVVSGSPPFVWAVTDVLTASGLPSARLASDVYAWATRP